MLEWYLRYLNYCVLSREQLLLTNSKFSLFDIIASFQDQMPSLLYNKLLKTRHPRHFSRQKSPCVSVPMISNMNGVDVKKLLVIKLFCYVVILKEVIYLKPRVKLQQVQFQASAIIPDSPFNELLTASQKQPHYTHIRKRTGIAKFAAITAWFGSLEISLCC